MKKQLKMMNKIEPSGNVENSFSKLLFLPQKQEQRNGVDQALLQSSCFFYSFNINTPEL